MNFTDTFGEYTPLIWILYALVIGYFIGKNRNNIRQYSKYMGVEIENAIGSMLNWYDEQKINKKLADKYFWWGYLNFCLVIGVIFSPIRETTFQLVIWLSVTILAFIIALLFFFYELQFMKEVWGTEIVEETVKAGG